MGRGRFTTLLGAATLIGVIGAWGMASWDAHDQVAQPNVVFIVLCSVRADQTGLFEGPVTMPFLDDFARRGVVLDDAWTAAPWTRPSTASLMTGRLPTSIGILDPGVGRSERTLADDQVTVAERFRDAGYWTFGRTGNPNTGREYGFGQGFDDYERLSRSGGGPDKVDGADLVHDLLAAVDSRPVDGAPGFLFALMVDAHAPTTVSPEQRHVWEAPGVSPNMAGYRAMLAVLDDRLKLLVDGLETRGWTAENTVFAIVNDHGEGLSEPEHHGRSHGWTLYPSVTRMVGAFVGPGVAQGRLRGIASGVDVAPTLADLAGLPQGDALDGQSLRASMQDPNVPSPRTEAWSMTMFGATERAVLVTEETACLGDFAQHDPEHPPREAWRSGCVERLSDPTWAFPQPHRAPMRHLRDAWADHRSNNERVGIDAVPPTDDVNDALRALGYVE